jgi:hypothetical protein
MLSSTNYEAKFICSLLIQKCVYISSLMDVLEYSLRNKIHMYAAFWYKNGYTYGTNILHHFKYFASRPLLLYCISKRRYMYSCVSKYWPCRVTRSPLFGSSLLSKVCNFKNYLTFSLWKSFFSFFSWMRIKKFLNFRKFRRLLPLPGHCRRLDHQPGAYPTQIYKKCNLFILHFESIFEENL